MLQSIGIGDSAVNCRRVIRYAVTFCTEIFYIDNVVEPVRHRAVNRWAWCRGREGIGSEWRVSHISTYTSPVGAIVTDQVMPRPAALHCVGPGCSATAPFLTVSNAVFLTFQRSILQNAGLAWKICKYHVSVWIGIVLPKDICVSATLNKFPACSVVS